MSRIEDPSEQHYSVIISLSLLVFSITDPIQIARSLLTPVSDQAFNALSSFHLLATSGRFARSSGSLRLRGDKLATSIFLGDIIDQGSTLVKREPNKNLRP